MFKSNIYFANAVLIIVLFLSACDSGKEVTTKPEAIRPAKLVQASTAAATEVNRFPALVGANRLSELSLQAGGLLKELPVKDAQRLERGDLIAQLDQRDFESAVASAKAQFQNAEKEYQRAVRLANEDAIARNVLEQRKTQRDVAKAQLDSAEKALSDSTLSAPYTGVVAQVLVNKLQNVSAGQAIVQFMSAGLLEASIDLPANFLANISKESKGDDRRAFVILDAAPNQLIEAEFKEASLIADTATQTYAITFTFRPPENLIVLPGMNATVELHFDARSDELRVVVPLNAIVSDGKDTYVWVVDKESMKVSKRAVSIEDGVGETVVVTSGLKGNESIVGAGAAYLSEGMTIKEWK